MKKTCCILCVLLLAVVFTSCGRLKSKSEMKNELHALFPDAVVADIQEGVSEDELKYADYTVKNHDVTFTVSNYQVDAGRITETDFYNNYAEKLLAHFEPEIARICEKYNVTSSIESQNLVLHSNINQLSDIDNGLGAVKELLLLLEPYLPTEAINKEECSFDFHVALQSEEAGGGIMNFASFSRKDEFNFEDEKKCLRFAVVNDIKSGYCSASCTQEELDMYPPKHITALKIDGVPFTSKRYETVFTYDILSEEYKTIVCYGTHLVYDNVVYYGEKYLQDDYLQREIIQSVYPQSNYAIDEKKEETTYNIGKDQYLIKVTEESDDDNPYFEFYRNGERLNIETKGILNHRVRTGATCYKFISVEDYAELMGMKVDSIDKDCICLSVK